MDWDKVFAYFWTCDRAAYLKTMLTIWKVQVQKIAEIGVFQGRLSARLREEFPQSHLYLVDPWQLPDLSLEAAPISYEEESYEKAYQTVKDRFCNDPQVTIFRKSSILGIYSRAVSRLKP